MRPSNKESYVRRLKFIANGLAYFAGLTGLLILAGWIFDVAVFSRILPGVERARPQTAITLLVGSVSLWLFLRTPSSTARWGARIAAGLMVLSGLLSLVESRLERSFGVLQVVHEVVVGGAAEELERSIAPTTGVSLVFLGLALLLLPARSRKSDLVGALLYVPPLLLSTMALLGYSYGVRDFYQVGFYTAMAFPSALAIFGLSAAIIFARPDRRPATLLVADSLSGFVARRLIAVALVVPPMLSWARLLGDRIGLYETEFGVALLTLFTMLVLTAVVIYMVEKLDSMEDELRRQTEIIRTIVDAAPAALFLVNKRNEVAFANREVLPMFGWTQNEIMGTVLHDLVHYRHSDGQPYPVEECPLVRAGAENRTLRDHEDVFFAKDRRAVNVLCSSAPLLAEDTTVGSVIVIQDISEWKRAAEALNSAMKRFESLANLIPQFAWSATPAGEIDYFNDRWYEYSGMPRGEEEMHHWVDFVHPADLERALRGWRDSIATGESLEMQIRFRRAGNGTYRWFMARAVPIRAADGTITRWFGTSTDIEEQRRQEERLEERVAERTAVAEGRAEQVRNLSVELTEAEQRERARVARVLHDDLQQILVVAKMQVGRFRRPSIEPESVAAMEKLLSQAIETTRSLSRELAPPILYQQGLGEAFLWLGHSAQAQYGFEVDVQISETGLPEEEWVRVFLYEMVRELLLNAAKHAGTDRVLLALKRDGGEIHVLVEDFGAGFSPEALPEKGVNAGSGLSYVQQRTALIGGKVTIDSAPGQGARIQISVPISLTSPVF